jgi:hypothetical protein
VEHQVNATEDLVNIDLDSRRNHIVALGLVVTSFTLMLTLVTAVTGAWVDACVRRGVDPLGARGGAGGPAAGCRFWNERRRWLPPPCHPATPPPSLHPRGLRHEPQQRLGGPARCLPGSDGACVASSAQLAALAAGWSPRSPRSPRSLYIF